MYLNLAADAAFILCFRLKIAALHLSLLLQLSNELKFWVVLRWATAVNKTAAGRRSIVGRIVAALPSVAIFLAFLVLVTSVFSVVGMQFFASKFQWSDGTADRANFDNFHQVCDCAPVHSA